MQGLVYGIRALLLKLVAPSLILLDVADDNHATPERVERLLALAPSVPLVVVVGALEAETWTPLQPRLAALLHRPISVGQIVDTVRRVLPLP